MAKLFFPVKNTMEEAIFALRNKGFIDVLQYVFWDDNFDTSKELQELIISKRTLGEIGVLEIGNLCLNQEIHNRGIDFYLRCLEGPQNKTMGFNYASHYPLTLADASRFSTAIASNDSIKLLSFEDYTGDNILFSIEGTFDFIFDAVLDGGVNKLLFAFGPSSNDILERVCTGRSKLATNTTLRGLNFEVSKHNADPQPVHATDDEGIKKLASVLKVNRGLETITIPRAMMTNVGRRYILDSLRDNITLSALDTTKSLFVGEDPTYNAEERKERVYLQSQIDHHMMLNRFWKRCNDKNNNWTGSSNDNNRTISLEIYPDLLEKLAKKQLLLFSFLQKDHPQIFTSFHERSQKRRRRRSMRIMKKRRIINDAAVEN
jgi:hypothetical protein